MTSEQIKGEISRLGLSEKLLLVEDIWDTIASQADQMEITEEEKALLDERLKAYHQNPNAGSPWELAPYLGRPR